MLKSSIIQLAIEKEKGTEKDLRIFIALTGRKDLEKKPDLKTQLLRGILYKHLIMTYREDTDDNEVKPGDVSNS
jgi:hypothetical protein